MSEEAPGDLELVRLFANTLDVTGQKDELETPAGLGGWLASVGLLDEAAAQAVTAEDQRLALAARTGLRALMQIGTHPDAEPNAEDLAALAALDEAADAARLTLRFARDSAALIPGESGVAGALGRLLAITAAALADGSWQRLKLCSDDGCAWAYYDHSRNRSGRWCSMAGCGNRAKVRAFRERTSTARVAPRESAG